LCGPSIVLKLCGVSKVFLKESVQHYSKSCYFTQIWH